MTEVSSSPARRRRAVKRPHNSPSQSRPQSSLILRLCPRLASSPSPSRSTISPCSCKQLITSRCKALPRASSTHPRTTCLAPNRPPAFWRQAVMTSKTSHRLHQEPSAALLPLAAYSHPSGHRRRTTLNTRSSERLCPLSRTLLRRRQRRSQTSRCQRSQTGQPSSRARQARCSRTSKR